MVQVATVKWRCVTGIAAALPSARWHSLQAVKALPLSCGIGAGLAA